MPHGRRGDEEKLYVFVVPVVGRLFVIFSIVIQLVPSVVPSTKSALVAFVLCPLIQKLN